MLVIGAIIGAGFASGRELVSFFGNHISIWIAPVCGVGYFIFNMIFLYIGSVVKKNNISEANKAIMGKFHFIADFFLLFNSLIVLSGMLAGMDSLFNEFLPIKPIYSLISGGICALITVKGIGGIMKVSNMIVPIIIAALFAVSFLNIEYPFSFSGEFRGYSLLIYIGMNLMLSSGFFVTLHELDKKTIIFSSLISSLILTILMAMLILALNNIDINVDMPVLALCNDSLALKIIVVIAIAVSIFTTMLTAMATLYSWLFGLTKSKLFSVSAIFISGLVISNFGFSNVVTYLYPIIGAAGIVYIVSCLGFVVRRNRLSALFVNTLFNNGNGKIHKRSKNTKYNRRRHDKV